MVEILVACEVWVPREFEFRFNWTTVTGKEVGISSVHLLNVTLNHVCELWGKERAELVKHPTNQPADDSPLDEAALHGLTLFCRHADFVTQHRLPVILDY